MTNPVWHDSGPAFPCGRDVTLGQFQPSTGMDLRDYFAAKAMQGLFADPSQVQPSSFSDEEWIEAISVVAYQTADAMLKARQA